MGNRFDLFEKYAEPDDDDNPFDLFGKSTGLTRGMTYREEKN